MADNITQAIDALASAAFVEGGVSIERTDEARAYTEQRKRELIEAIAASQPQAVAAQAPAAVATHDQIAFLNSDRDGWIEAHAKIYRAYQDLRNAADDLLTCVMHDGVLVDPEHPKRIAVEAVKAALCATPALPATEPAHAAVGLTDALRDLIEAIEYTPLGIRQIKALERARAAIKTEGELPATEDSSAGDLAEPTEAQIRWTVAGKAYGRPTTHDLREALTHALQTESRICACPTCVQADEAEVQAAPVALHDDAYTALQFVEGHLAAIANRQFQSADTIEPVDTIAKAAKRAKAALNRLQSVAHHFDTAPQAQPADALDAETVKKAARYDWIRDNHVRAWNSRLESTKGKKTLDIDFEADGHDLDAAVDAAMAAAQEGGAA